MMKIKSLMLFFDWDNTSIINDVEEALLAYQLENLEFKMTPEEFSNTIRINIPKDNFKESCNNAEGNLLISN